MIKKLLFACIATTFAFTVSAKDIKTVVFTTQPIMHCENCENKIKGNMRFEKGVKKIETNIEKQEVTITFDAEKTNAEKLKNAFQKFGYEATIVEKNKTEENVTVSDNVNTSK